jgi:hypothetical protein
VVDSTRPIAPSGSTLPRLAAELPVTLLLLDPYRGALGMIAQLTAALEAFAARSVTLVDVGGGVVANGDESELKSPIADCLALAARAALPVPVDVAVLGPGLDGELPAAYVIDRIQALGGGADLQLGPQAAAVVLEVFAWHPSEASGMLAAAAAGVRGAVEIRDAGIRIVLDERSIQVHRVEAGALASAGLLCSRIAATTTLEQVEAVTRQVCGRSELDYERERASVLGAARQAPVGPRELERRVTAFEREASGCGSDYVTIRRLAEAVGAPRGPGLEPWRKQLITVRPERYAPPLWAVGQTAPG